MDLFYRIAVTNIAIPPLRERKDDIPALVTHWLGQLCERYRPAGGLVRRRRLPVPAGLRLAGQYPRIAQRAGGLLADGRRRCDHHGQAAARNQRGGHAGRRRLAQGPAGSAPETVYSLEMAESESIRKALAYSGGNLTRTASRLGIAKSTLYQKIRKYGLSAALSETRGRVT
ncbi:helix-turn-helix domain-containing protein [Cupriavidus basilensis]